MVVLQDKLRAVLAPCSSQTYTAPCPAWSALAASTPGRCPPMVTLSVRHQHLPWYLQKRWLCTDCVWHRKISQSTCLVSFWNLQMAQPSLPLFPKYFTLRPSKFGNKPIGSAKVSTFQFKISTLFMSFFVEYVNCAHFTWKKCHVVVMKYCL